MNKWIIIATASFLVVLLYVHFSTSIYVQNQSEDICYWLNNNKNTQPKVGPHAYQHLQELKEQNNNGYNCSVVTSPHEYGYKYETAILIEKNNQKLIYLIYGLGFGGRHFLRPRYFQHWSNTEHAHK